MGSQNSTVRRPPGDPHGVFHRLPEGKAQLLLTAAVGRPYGFPMVNSG